MKNKIRNAFSALVLGMGVFFMPITASAAGGADITPPAVNAEVEDGVIHIEAKDDDTGVDAVFIGGKRVNYRVDDMLDLELRDFVEDGQETVDIYAIDFAGNQSETVVLNVAQPNPDAEEKPFTPDGQATVLDHATNEDGKEFYTFTTPEENVFYLVIDRQRESENVYFLNAVMESDLAALATKDENAVTEDIMTTEPAVCSCEEKCEAGKVDTSCGICRNDLEACKGKPAEPTEAAEPETAKKNSGGTFLFVILALLAAGGAGYYFKIYKPKHELDDAEDLDDLLDDTDEPEINEDETPNDEGYDNYPYDDYPDVGDERGE